LPEALRKKITGSFQSWVEHNWDAQFINDKPVWELNGYAQTSSGDDARYWKLVFLYDKEHKVTLNQSVTEVTYGELMAAYHESLFNDDAVSLDDQDMSF
jgi:hypothetical protein